MDGCGGVHLQERDLLSGLVTRLASKLQSMQMARQRYSAFAALEWENAGGFAHFAGPAKPWRAVKGMRPCRRFVHLWPAYLALGEALREGSLSLPPELTAPSAITPPLSERVDSVKLASLEVAPEQIHNAAPHARSLRGNRSATHAALMAVRQRAGRQGELSAVLWRALMGDDLPPVESI